MKIRIPQYAKDLIDQKPHQGFSRRDFLKNGIATSAATIMLPHALTAALAKKAFGDTMSCPAGSRQQGALGQIYRSGGPTVGAMFLNEAQVGFMNAAAAKNYGIVQADIVQVGKNWYLAKSSPFAAGVMTPPAGYTQSQWNAVLMKTSLGGHYGPFNADDGAGSPLGNVGAAAFAKQSQVGKDLRIKNNDPLASWAAGVASANVNANVNGSGTNLTSASIAQSFGITPANGITSQVMTNSAQAASSLSQIFANLFGSAGRTDAAGAMQKSVCGFMGDSVMADPNYGNSLFNPMQISALSSAVQLGSMTPFQQAMLASFYQSAIGTIGGVMVQQGGCDYHGTSVQNTITPSDFEAGQMVAMFLAACDIARTKGAFISVHNGQAIANGTQAATTSTGMNVMGPVATGDAGGSYNAGFILCYDPSSPPTLSSTGTFDTTSGKVKAAANVGTVPMAVAGLYLTAFAHLGLDVNAAATKMQVPNASGIMLI